MGRIVIIYQLIISIAKHDSGWDESAEKSDYLSLYDNYVDTSSLKLI